MAGGAQQQELSESADPAIDFCLWPYTAPSAPAAKLRSINLLNHSFEVAGANSRLFEVTQAIRHGFGAFNTVWGVKKRGDELSWEYYFYDYDRLDRTSSISRFLQVTAPYFDCRLVAQEGRPYFMFSVDLDDALLSRDRLLDEINIYMGNVGSEVSSGICYSQTEAGLRMDNLYYFFDAKRQWDDIVGKAACSAHLDLPELQIKQILWPELVDCQTIVVANKKYCEGLYFSRITVDQLLLFMKRLAYPTDLVLFIEKNRNRLDHMLYDVGIDYVMESGSIVPIKSAYYGVF